MQSEPLTNGPTGERPLFEADRDTLHRLFDATWDELDHVNALTVFGKLAEHRYRDAIATPEFNRALPPVISSFAPKSGGTFLHNRMLGLGYREFWWTMVDPRCHSWCYVSDEALRLYSRGGCACHTHARPQPNVLAALDRARHRKVWVHLRSPAECVVSAWHHLQGEGHGTGEVAEERRKQAAEMAEAIGDDSAELSRFTVGQIDWFLDWAVQWLDYAQRRPDAVVLSYYDELADPQRLFERVFGELGVPLPPTPVEAAFLPQDRVRQKATKSWRDGLSPGVVALVEERTRAALAPFPAAERLWS